MRALSSFVFLQPCLFILVVYLFSQLFPLCLFISFCCSVASFCVFLAVGNCHCCHWCLPITYRPIPWARKCPLFALSAHWCLVCLANYPFSLFLRFWPPILPRNEVFKGHQGTMVDTNNQSKEQRQSTQDIIYAWKACCPTIPFLVSPFPFRPFVLLNHPLFLQQFPPPPPFPFGNLQASKTVNQRRKKQQVPSCIASPEQKANRSRSSRWESPKKSNRDVKNESITNKKKLTSIEIYRVGR